MIQKNGYEQIFILIRESGAPSNAIACNFEPDTPATVTTNTCVL
jgi:hypothetical protein